jgi:hypothetical protein
MPDQFEKWKKLLAGEPVEMHENEPIPGYYRTRMGKDGPWVPVAIWNDAKGETLALRAGSVVDVGQVWPYCAKHPIAYATYQTVAERGEDWPDQHPAVAAMGHNAGPADDSFEGLTEAITELGREAEKLIKAGGAKTQAEADQASHLANKIGELQKKADEQRKKEKQPHDDKAKEVQQKWLPLIQAADIYKRIKEAVITPFLKAEDAKLRAAEQAALRAAASAVQTGAGPVEPPLPLPTAKAGSAGRRSIALRTVTRVAITDRAALLEYFKDRQEITEALQDMAEKAVKAGITPPGVEVQKDQVAA